MISSTGYTNNNMEQATKWTPNVKEKKENLKEPSMLLKNKSPKVIEKEL